MNIQNILKNDKYIVFYDLHNAYDRMNFYKIPSVCGEILNFNTMGEVVIHTENDSLMVIPYKSIVFLKRIKRGDSMDGTDKNELIQHRIQTLFDTEDDNILDNIVYNLEVLGLPLFAFDGKIDYWNFRNKCSDFYENLLNEILEDGCGEYNMGAFQRLIHAIGDLVGQENVRWFLYLTSNPDGC